jgi:hypothetical protein
MLYNDTPDMCREPPSERQPKLYSRYAYVGFRVVVEGRRHPNCAAASAFIITVYGHHAGQFRCRPRHV